MGADFSIQSATKYIGGHSDLLLGVVTVRNVDYADALRKRRVMLGATPGSLEAWLALRGVRTMSLRVARSMNSAIEIAQLLQAHPAVGRVLYPGLAEHPQHELATKQMRGYGGVISFTVAAGKEAAQQMCESLTLITHATSLGGVESTIERRARHALEHADVPENLVRLSVGIEAVSDLWRELETALSRTLS
jgi:cystathionine gamma-synthase